MPLHNEAASTASLAKTILMGLDKSKPETVIATLTLELLCETICNLVLVGGGQAVDDGARRTVMSAISEMNRGREQ